MDFDYLYPHFTDKDEEAAKNFLVNIMMPSDLQLQLDETKMRQFFNEMIRNIYGVNIVDIANLRLCEKTFLFDIKPYISQYMKFRKQKVEFIVYNHPAVLTYYLQAISKKEGFQPIKNYWNPNEKWNIFNIFDDYSKNIMHPLTQFYWVWIAFKGMTKENADFIRRLSIILNNKKIIYNKDKECFDDIVIQLLPTDNLNLIVKIQQLIEQFF